MALTVERIEDGEVSPYLVDELAEGDQLELRGPIGGYFVWSTDMGGPLLLVAGGSGICPLMAMLRHRAARGSQVPTRLLYSSRSLEDVIYREELDRLAARADGLEVFHTLTRSQPADWHGYCEAHRPRHAGRGWFFSRAAPAVHGVRADSTGRGGRHDAGRVGPSARSRQDRAIRTNRRLAMDETQLRLDGNAAAGLIARGLCARPDALRVAHAPPAGAIAADGQPAPVHVSAVAGRSASLQQV